MALVRSKRTYTSRWDGCPLLPARYPDMEMAFRPQRSTRSQHGVGARRDGRLDHLRDIYISQRRGGVQWLQLDQNGHILDDGMGVLCCQLDFMI